METCCTFRQISGTRAGCTRKLRHAFMNSSPKFDQSFRLSKGGAGVGECGVETQR